MGQSFLRQVKKKNGINVVRWIDAGADDMGISMVDNTNVLSYMDPSEYDYIVISVEKEQLASEIITSISAFGIDEKKILWKNPKVG